jgi:peroxiredoxin Q/BCP
MGELAVGDRAPAFALRDQDGDVVRLSSFKGRPLVVFFYPKADTPGCTQQACNVRDAAAELRRRGAAVVGISPDAPEKQARFDAKHGLGFRLLSDPDHEVAERWGAWGEKSMYGKKYQGVVRSVFVVDEKGRLAAVHYKVSPKDTVPSALAAL